MYVNRLYLRISNRRRMIYLGMILLLFWLYGLHCLDRCTICGCVTLGPKTAIYSVWVLLRLQVVCHPCSWLSSNYSIFTQGTRTDMSSLFALPLTVLVSTPFGPQRWCKRSLQDVGTNITSGVVISANSQLACVNALY